MCVRKKEYKFTSVNNKQNQLCVAKKIYKKTYIVLVDVDKHSSSPMQTEQHRPRATVLTVSCTPSDAGLSSMRFASPSMHTAKSFNQWPLLESVISLSRQRDTAGCRLIQEGIMNSGRSSDSYQLRHC